MNSRAEAEMREAGKKMMDAAVEKKEAEEKVKVGQWKITIKGSKHTTKDVEAFIDQLIQFTKDCDENNPNIEMSVDPIIEIK